MRKNRYRDIIPYDHARVVLPSEKGDEGDEMVGSDYVNASYVYNAEGAVSAVAAQGPLPHTTDDFWRMVFHVRARVIVMVCNVIEKDRFKCAKYWPDMGETEEVGALEVKALSEENKGNGIILRKFQVRGARRFGFFFSRTALRSSIPLPLFSCGSQRARRGTFRSTTTRPGPTTACPTRRTRSCPCWA